MQGVDIRVISLKEDCELLRALREDFGENVKRLPAVDMRSVKPLSLVQSGAVTMSAGDALVEGRKWHKELTSVGTSGLFLTNRLLLHESDNPLLAFEEDCRYDKTKLVREIHRLRTMPSTPDVAVFGAGRLTGVTEPREGPWKQLITGKFFMTHCVFYSVEGRRRVREHIDQPQEVQYDAFLAMLASYDLARVYLQTGRSIAWQQSFRRSTLQTAPCLLCDVPPNIGISRSKIVIAILVAVLLALAALCRRV